MQPAWSMQLTTSKLGQKKKKGREDIEKNGQIPACLEQDEVESAYFKTDTIDLDFSWRNLFIT